MKLHFQIPACAIILCIASLPASAQAPTGLTVKSATSSQVALSWTGTAPAYTVQRAPVGGAQVNIATVSTTTYTDTQVDPGLQFTYQVIAGTTGTAASNAVTTGPPPAGLSIPAPSPAIGPDPSPKYGANITMTLDGNGDPAFAFLWLDPNNTNKSDQSLLMFRSWNRAQAAWNPLAKVGVVGDVSSNSAATTSLAYDSGTKTFAVASNDFTGALRLYVSTDGGLTFSLKQTFSKFNNATTSPSLALASGNLHLSMNVENTGIVYVTGNLSADPATWTLKVVPAVKDVDIALHGVMTSLALDATGNPAIAFWASDLTPGQSYNSILLLWKPAGTASPVKVLDSQNNQSDEVAVKLSFYGNNPRVVAFVARPGFAALGQGVQFARSDDGGATWRQPVAITPDGHSSTDYPFDMAFDSKGNGAILFGQNSGAGDTTCPSPKLARSSDLVNWTTCGVANDLGNFGNFPGGLNLAFQTNDKIYAMWWNQDVLAASGVILYREPPPNQPSAPVISAVQDAESSGTSIVPGSWVAIYGANMAGTTRTWAESDFVTNSNALPSKLTGVTVQFNGLPAAVFFISPTQIDVQAPSGITGTVPVTVTNNGAVSAALNVNVVQNQPSLFYYPSGTKLYPAAIHLDGALIGDPAVVQSARKVKAGETIVLFVNGIAPSPSGTIIAAPISYASPVTVTIGSTSVTAAFAGLVAAGEYQLNVVVPGTLTTGEYPISVTAAGQKSTTAIMLPVQ
jgi:uncharacterized protein (TIGR03437 family)